ncbi:transcription elongation factor GreA [Pseudolysinimonas yzui]|jgi:transcription elongation factor GreA|uniref:Transcription elongation factor GreA n=1 Tax=Pseudolysinimonas yzui TaxID=2708254 RepID=A0A8J3M1T3_9MICO|nr:transcription elongation factor GreA [Pseudolysinimonas yzui]GHF18537.1 transcription elongation factor GreA [Pseudolysinimonas yzui]
MSDTAATTWLTQESYDRLSAELAELEGPARLDIAKKIEMAREEGDLKENGGYHAAKDEQGKIEARIRQLTQLLRHATVGEPPAASGVVEIGTVVTAKIAGDPTTFLLGSREIADDDIDVYPATSALGEAILGLKVGEKTSYTAPNGKEIAVEVTKVETYRG